MLKSVNDMLVETMGPLGPLFAVGALGILLIIAALPTIMKKTVDPFSKFRDATKPTNPSRRDGQPAKKMLRAGRGTDKLDKFATFLEPKSAEEMSSARLTMMRAGYRGKNAVRTFHAVQFILGIFFLLVGIIYAIFASATGEIATTTLVLVIIMPGAIGYYLPKYWVERRVQSRQREIQDGFPDALDMLLVCVEAGQSLDQGIIRVSKELSSGYPALAEEFE
ncbi:MAG: type II secretion system F family protein, partial [Rhodobacteraceae bacterium]|nr:type II secretion system F family protein [Paracoccaceae bacterium]